MAFDKILSNLNQLPIIKKAERIVIPHDLRKQLQPALLSEIQTMEKHVKAYRFAYISQGHTVIGYLSVPRKLPERAPVIFFNRGGSREFGAIRIGQLFSGTIAALVRAGYVVITTQYSGVAGGEGIDQMGGSDIEDVISLKTIVDGLHICNPEQIGMYGFSRGGMMTYQLLREVHWIKAAVVVSGPTDFFALQEFRPEMKDHFKEMFGGSDDEMRKRSVIYWYQDIPTSLPLLILSGMSDQRVAPKDAFRFAEKACDHFIFFKFVAYPQGTHGLHEHQIEMDSEIIRWFDTYVLKKDMGSDKVPTPYIAPSIPS